MLTKSYRAKTKKKRVKKVCEKLNYRCFYFVFCWFSHRFLSNADQVILELPFALHTYQSYRLGTHNTICENGTHKGLGHHTTF